MSHAIDQERHSLQPHRQTLFAPPNISNNFPGSSLNMITVASDKL